LKLRTAFFFSGFFLLTDIQPAASIEIEAFSSVVQIPAGVVLTLENDTAVEVDQFSLEGQIVTNGHVFRVDSDLFKVGAEGRIFGFDRSKGPAKPPQTDGYPTPAATCESAPKWDPC
jgi:hypothetical protein